MSNLPIFAVPGTLCDARLFGPIAELLDTPIIAAAPIDAPAVGQAAAGALIDAPARFIALGFSLGGFVVLEMLRRAPERIGGAILISSNARADPEANALVRRDQLQLACTHGLPALIDTLWPRYVAPAARYRGDIRALLVEMAESVGTDRLATQTELAITRPDSRADLARIAVPLLLIRGEADDLCPADRQEEMHAAAPHARLVTIEGAGHFAPIERATAVADAIRAWQRIDLAA